MGLCDITPVWADFPEGNASLATETMLNNCPVGAANEQSLLVQSLGHLLRIYTTLSVRIPAVARELP